MHARTMMATTIASFALLTVALPQPQSESIEPDAQKNDPNPTADQVSEGGYSCGTNEAGGHPGGLYIPLQSASNTFDQFCKHDILFSSSASLYLDVTDARILLKVDKKKAT